MDNLVLMPLLSKTLKFFATPLIAAIGVSVPVGATEIFYLVTPLEASEAAAPKQLSLTKEFVAGVPFSISVPLPDSVIRNAVVDAMPAGLTFNAGVIQGQLDTRGLHTFNIALQAGSKSWIVNLSLTAWDELTLDAGGFRWTSGLASNSCKDYLGSESFTRYNETGSGMYWINTAESSPAQVYCDMSPLDPGWTLVANRKAQSAMSNPMEARFEITTDSLSAILPKETLKNLGAQGVSVRFVALNNSGKKVQTSDPQAMSNIANWLPVNYRVPVANFTITGGVDVITSVLDTLVPPQLSMDSSIFWATSNNQGFHFEKSNTCWIHNQACLPNQTNDAISMWIN